MNLNSPLSSEQDCVRERLQHQVSTIVDMAVSSVFEDSLDLRKALAEMIDD